MKIKAIIGIAAAAAVVLFGFKMNADHRASVEIANEAVPLADRPVESYEYVSFEKEVTVNDIDYILYSDHTAVLIKSNNLDLEVFDGELNYKGSSYIITDIRLGAFGDHKKLKEVTLKDGIKKIGFAAFSNCDLLEKVTIADTLETLGGTAFRGCTSLKTISIPAGVSEIEPWTFSYCNSLEKVELSENCVKIGDYAFMYCEQLSEVLIEGEHPSFDWTTIENDKMLPLSNRTIELGDGVFDCCNRL